MKRLDRIFGVLGASSFAAALALAAALPAGSASADEEEYFRPVTDKTVMTECAACHMAFPAGMLPARSWEAVMSDLPNHFGEDASLDDATRAKITDYLVANAAREGSWIARSMAKGDPVLRISDSPWWIEEHRGEVGPKAFENPKVGSKANCVACHRDANSGYFEDD